MKQRSKGQQSVKGLSNAEVLKSRERFGANVFTPVATVPWWSKLLEKFRDPLIVILLIAGVLSVGIAGYEYYETGETANLFEPIGIFIAVFLATGLSFRFEHRAEKEFSLLNKVKDDEQVQVIRNHRVCRIAKRDVVVGDIVLLQTGDEIPADGVLQSAVNLRVDESSLTGEPETSKSAQDTADSDTAYPLNKVYRGTNIIEGHGMMKVEAVGDRTEIGKTRTAAQVETSVRTPLNEQLDRLSRWITNWSYAIAGLVIVVGTFVHFDWDWQCLPVAAVVGVFFYLVMFKFKKFSRTTCILLFVGFFALFIGMVIWLSELHHADLTIARHIDDVMGIIMVAVTLIVVAVPEGLPMAVALSLAYNMRRMLKNNNLVRRMHACETMGAVTVICTDKTGTLTQNRMQVSESRYFGEWADESNTPRRDILAESIAVNATAQLEYSVENSDQAYVLGNPTEGAMLLWLDGKGYDYLVLREGSEVLQEIPFSTERKFMATEVVSGIDGKRRLYVKGAPGIVRAMCESGIAGGVTTDEVKAIIETYQSQAMRTLALAVADLNDDEEGIVNGQIDTNALQLVGIVAISDPVRPEVPNAIAECRHAGIEVKIVTGDSRSTAREIARQIGIWNDDTPDDSMITGFDFEKLSDDELRERVKTLKVIARARPLDKQRLVEALQANGAVVAVTGDGTNDAPALHTAHVGLSMGSGTAVAKEASDITIIDNSFAGIGSAVMWGRSLYRNIQRFIMFQLTVNVIACLIVLVGSFMDVESPLTVTQMLWINLIMDTFAAMALASLPPDNQVMNDPPRDRKAFILSPGNLRRVSVSGLLGFVVMYVMLLVFSKYDFNDLSQALTNAAHFRFNGIVDDKLTGKELTVFFTSFVMMQFWNIFNARAFMTGKSALRLKDCTGFLTIIAVILIGQVAMVQINGLNDVFRAVPLSAAEWLWIIGISSLVLWLGEFYRLLFDRKRDKNLTQ